MISNQVKLATLAIFTASVQHAAATGAATPCAKCILAGGVYNTNRAEPFAKYSLAAYTTAGTWDCTDPTATNGGETTGVVAPAGGQVYTWNAAYMPALASAQGRTMAAFACPFVTDYCGAAQSFTHNAVEADAALTSATLKEGYVCTYMIVGAPGVLPTFQLESAKVGTSDSYYIAALEYGAGSAGDNNGQYAWATAKSTSFANLGSQSPDIYGRDYLPFVAVSKDSAGSDDGSGNWPGKTTYVWPAQIEAALLATRTTN
jgi:hypothetical protein